MKVFCLTLITCIFLFSKSTHAQTTSPQTLTIQAPTVNLRAAESLTSTVLAKLTQLDELEILSQGKTEKIDGVVDWWYKVKTNDSKIGYVFGHLTSMKQAGRKKIEKKFTACESGDYFHLLFEDIDFGHGNNNLGIYTLCIENEGTTNAEFAGHTFRITMNMLYSRTYCGEGSSEICIKAVPTILELVMID